MIYTKFENVSQNPNSRILLTANSWVTHVVVRATELCVFSRAFAYRDPSDIKYNRCSPMGSPALGNVSLTCSGWQTGEVCFLAEWIKGRGLLCIHKACCAGVKHNIAIQLRSSLYYLVITQTHISCMARWHPPPFVIPQIKDLSPASKVKLTVTANCV